MMIIWPRQTSCTSGFIIPSPRRHYHSYPRGTAIDIAVRRRATSDNFRYRIENKVNVLFIDFFFLSATNVLFGSNDQAKRFVDNNFTLKYNNITIEYLCIRNTEKYNAHVKKPR